MSNDQGYRFIWITDGLGWKSALKPLEEAFQHIDYILNLKMVTSGLLSQIILNKL
jgi:type II restriction enzyme